MKHQILGLARKHITQRCSIPLIGLSSVLFAVFSVLSLHIHIATPSQTQAGQSIWGTPLENTFSSFSLLDIVLLVVFSAGFACIFCLLCLLFGKKASPSAIISNPFWRTWPVLFLIILAFWLPYLLSWTPGGVYSDTYISIEQAQGVSPLNNRHTVLYSLEWRACFGIASLFGQDSFVACLVMLAFQSFVMAGILSYSVIWLARHGLGRIGCALATAFFALCPLFPYYAISLWKDTLFSAYLMWYGLCFADISLSRRPPSHKQVLALCISGLLSAFSRNNGTYILLGGTAILLVLYRKQLRKLMLPLVVPIVSTVLFTLAIQGPVFSLLNLNVSSTVESLGVPLQQIARTIYYDGSLSSEAEEVFFSILPEETWKEAYRPLLVDSIKWNGEFNEVYLNEHRSEFLRAYIETGFHNPHLYLEGFLMSNCGFWDPFVGGGENIAYAQLEMWHSDLPPYQIDVPQLLTGVSLREVLSPKAYISCAVFVWVALGSLSVLLIHKKWKWACCLAPAFFLWATLIIASPIAYSLRYCFYLVMLIPIAVALPVLALRESNDEHLVARTAQAVKGNQ